VESSIFHDYSMDIPQISHEIPHSCTAEIVLGGVHPGNEQLVLKPPSESPVRTASK